MSLQDVLLFIQRVAAEPALQDEMRALGPNPELQDLILGHRLDLEFSAGELTDAFARDWVMRRAHFTEVVESPSD